MFSNDTLYISASIRISYTVVSREAVKHFFSLSQKGFSVLLLLNKSISSIGICTFSRASYMIIMLQSWTMWTMGLADGVLN